MMFNLPTQPLMDADNYSAWSFQMKACLELQDVWDVIEASEGEISTDSAKVKKARAMLILSIHETLYPKIKSLSGAKAIWDAMEDAFKGKAPINQPAVMKEFFHTNLEDCESVLDYISKISNAALKLEAKDELLALVLLAGLPQSYRPLILALDNEPNLTSDLVKTKIIWASNWIRIEPELGGNSKRRTKFSNSS